MSVFSFRKPSDSEKKAKLDKQAEAFKVLRGTQQAAAECLASPLFSDYKKSHEIARELFYQMFLDVDAQNPNAIHEFVSIQADARALCSLLNDVQSRAKMQIGSQKENSNMGVDAHSS